MGLYIGNTRYCPVIGKVKVLPYDAEVEYLQSDGSAYIDTGILTTSNIKVVASFTVLSGVPNAAIYGGRIALNDNSNALFCLSSNNGWSWRYGDVNKNLSNTTITGSFIINNKADVKTLVFKGSLDTSIASDAATFTTIYPMYIFALNNGGTVGSVASSVRIKRFVMYDGSTLVRDYIPVIKSGVGYLYDKVSGELFGNTNSTGAFTYGNDIT